MSPGREGSRGGLRPAAEGPHGPATCRRAGAQGPSGASGAAGSSCPPRGGQRHPGEAGAPGRGSGGASPSHLREGVSPDEGRERRAELSLALRPLGPSAGSPAPCAGGSVCLSVCLGARADPLCPRPRLPSEVPGGAACLLGADVCCRNPGRVSAELPRGSPASPSTTRHEGLSLRMMRAQSRTQPGTFGPPATTNPELGPPQSTGAHRGQMSSGRALLGSLPQQEAAHSPRVGWFLTWRGGGWSRGQLGELRGSAHPFGGVACRGQAPSSAFAPNTALRP